MPYSVYKVMHILGIVMVFVSLGGVALHLIGNSSKDFAAKKLALITHGTGLLLALVGGFGLLARIGGGFQPWVWGKLAIWIVLGGLITFLLRKPQIARATWFVILFIGALATYLANYKPGT